jgi:sec-independent protein translocase protein TatB
VGFSLGEIILLILVGIIVVGPKNLPGMMRTAGQWIARLRRMSTDLRSQSGIDDLIRQEGLEPHLHEIRSLSRMNVVETLMAPAVAAASVQSEPALPPARPRDFLRQEPLREREYPLAGCDAAGAVPDDAAPYVPAEVAAPAPPAAADTPAGEGPAPQATPHRVGSDPSITIEEVPASVPSLRDHAASAARVPPPAPGPGENAGADGAERPLS